MRLKIQTCICSPNLVILLPGKYDCSEQSGSQSFGSAIVSSTDTCLQKSKPNPTFQGTPVCHSAIRERLLQLGDTMKAAGGWHLEDRFQSWVHKQPWRQMLPLDGFECFACMNPKQIYLNVWFLPSQCWSRFYMPKLRAVGERTIPISVMLPHEILASLYNSGNIHRLGSRKVPSL